MSLILKTPYVAVVDGGKEFEGDAMVNLQTGQVSDINYHDLIPGCCEIEERYIVLNSERVYVYNGEPVGVEFEFWADINSVYEN